MAILANLWASSVSALLARFFVHPMDTLKTRLQADYSLRSRGLRSAALHIYKTEGLKAFYRGLPVTLALSVPALSVYLFIYDCMKSIISDSSNPLTETSPLTHLTSATIAEIFSGLFWTPLEVIKSKLQMQRHDHYSSLQEFHSSPTTPTGSLPNLNRQQVSNSYPSQSKTIKICSRIWNREGIQGFFRGYWLSLTVFVPYSVIYFVSYEQFKLALAHKYHPLISDSDLHKITLPFYAYLFAAAGSGTLAAMFSNPFDRIKTIVQVAETAHEGNVREVIKNLIRDEGIWRACTRGTLSRILWAVPNLCISMTVYESMKS